VKVRYKQTVLGAGWAILQPLAAMVVFSLFFGRVAKVPSAGFPYPLFVFAGLLPWMFFANAVTTASQSVIGSQNMVTKIYFPRLMLPLATVAAAAVDFLIGLCLLLLMMFSNGVHPGWPAITALALIACLTITAVGVGTLLAALTVAYRDFRYAVPFLIQLWMFATPSIYLASEGALDRRWNRALALNPAHGLIENFRLALLAGRIEPESLAISTAVTIALLIVGCFYFRRVERHFADII
jgi:lipopolysaccharide transport system permease protein